MTPEQLKASILQRAMEGKLVPQDPNDEPASELLKRIKIEKEKLIKEGKIKRDKNETEIFKGDDGLHYEKFADGTVKEIDVPYELPEGWEWVTLGNIGNWGSGATPAKSNPKFYVDGQIPWLLTGDLNDDYIIKIDGKITELALEKTSVRLNPEGSVLIAMYGATIGRVGILTFPSTTNQACCACNTLIEVNNRYLFYFLMSQRSAFAKRAEGGAQPNISKEKIIKTFFPLPPLFEQERIVNQIDLALEKINEYESSYSKLEELNKTFPEKLRKSILQYAMQGKLVPQDPNDEPVEVLLEKIRAEKQRLYKEGKLKKKDLEESIIYKGDDNSYYENMFPKHWIITRINQIGEILTGNTPSKTDRKNWGGNNGFFKPSDLTQGISMQYPSEYLTDTGFNKSRKIPRNTVLVNGIGNIGITGLTLIEGAFNQQMHGIIARNYMEPKFIYWLMKSYYVSEQMKINSSSTTIPILNKSRFSEIVVAIPNKQEQMIILERISQFEKCIEDIFRLV